MTLKDIQDKLQQNNIIVKDCKLVSQAIIKLDGGGSIIFDMLNGTYIVNGKEEVIENITKLLDS